jgi:AcrR family transcriptional regulator
MMRHTIFGEPAPPPPAVADRVSYPQLRVAGCYDLVAFRAFWTINGMVRPPDEVYTDPQVVACTWEALGRHGQRPAGGPAHPRAVARRPRGLILPGRPPCQSARGGPRAWAPGGPLACRAATRHHTWQNPLTRASAQAHDQTVIVKPNRDRRAERHEAIRREILDAAWDAAHETSIAGLTLRDIATRVGMQQPSLYSHFASKQAIYDAMFKQAWQTYLDDARNSVGGLPAQPRPRLIAIAEHYFDFAVADLPRHQLMDVNVVPNFQPSPEAYAPAVQAYNLMLDQLRGMGITRDEDADVYTALIGGLVSQQLANDPDGQRWRRLIPRVMLTFADDLGLP